MTMQLGHKRPICSRVNVDAAILGPNSDILPIVNEYRAQHNILSLVALDEMSHARRICAQTNIIDRVLHHSSLLIPQHSQTVLYRICSILRRILYIITILFSLLVIGQIIHVLCFPDSIIVVAVAAGGPSILVDVVLNSPIGIAPRLLPGVFLPVDSFEVRDPIWVLS